MAIVVITLGPHELNPGGPNQDQSVDGDTPIKVMGPNGPMDKLASSVEAGDRVCFAPGVCLPVVAVA